MNAGWKGKSRPRMRRQKREAAAHAAADIQAAPEERRISDNSGAKGRKGGNMNVSEFAKASGYAVFTKGEDRAIQTGYCGDFLSNIISRATDSCAWLTVMNNVNVAAVATLIDCACIILCEGTEPDEALYARAGALGIWILGTGENVFEAAKTVARLCGV